MIKRLKLMWPVFFRLIILFCISLGVAGIAKPAWGFALLILGLLLEILMHLNYIALLAQWLEEPGLPDTPSVRSALWSEIFYRVAKSRRQLEKIRADSRNERLATAKRWQRCPKGSSLSKTTGP